MNISDDESKAVIGINVEAALREDIGSGDLTASLLPSDASSSATVVTREAMILAGKPWFDEVYRQLDPDVVIEWSCSDGDALRAGDRLCRLSGRARALVSGERCALNFLQLLSGTATLTAAYVEAIDGTGARVLDTRKTIPGLRLAQKYAVRCGGGVNHRIGLFDAILIKENHILACGSIKSAVAAARKTPRGSVVEVEVESIDELREAMFAGAERILLDNFSHGQLIEAVRLKQSSGQEAAALEASGGITLETIRKVAETGVDFISVGALTKNPRAIDLSMRFD